MLVRVYTSEHSFYWAWFVDVYDSEYLQVRVVATDKLKLVRKEQVK